MVKLYTQLVFYILRLYASLPMGVLFFFSDVLFFPIVYHVGRYRRKTVRKNLLQSFPDYSMEQILKLERRFYHHFCDSFQETIRILSMSEAEAVQRMKFVNPEIIHEIMGRGQGILVVLGHYGNWEYQPFLALQIDDIAAKQCFNVYRPLKDQVFDELMKRVRTRFGGNNVTKSDTYRTIIQLRREKLAGVFGLVSDQSPSRMSSMYWTNFLNQDTSILNGPERMAKQTGFAVVYADVEKLSRGRYQTTFRLITDKPESAAEFEITERYARLMEKTILKDPAYWLWTHNRWKFKREKIEV